MQDKMYNEMIKRTPIPSLDKLTNFRNIKGRLHDQIFT